MGGETLVRWRFEGRDIAPSVFIPLLEKNNMIHLVERWVFDQTVCTGLRVRSYDESFYLSFNVSLQQMSDETFPEFMAQTPAKYAMSGVHFVAEMTESCMDAEVEKLRRFVRFCKEKGIRLALDDFGSGYSSFRMLLQYPTDIIKIDRSILKEMTKSDEKMNFISSIVYACHRFGKKVCMEAWRRKSRTSLSGKRNATWYKAITITVRWNWESFTKCWLPSAVWSRTSARKIPADNTGRLGRPRGRARSRAGGLRLGGKARSMVGPSADKARGTSSCAQGSSGRCPRKKRRGIFTACRPGSVVRRQARRTAVRA